MKRLNLLWIVSKKLHAVAGSIFSPKTVFSPCSRKRMCAAETGNTNSCVPQERNTQKGMHCRVTGSRSTSNYASQGHGIKRHKQESIVEPQARKTYRQLPTANHQFVRFRQCVFVGTLLMILLLLGCQTDKMLLRKQMKSGSSPLIAKVFNSKNRALAEVTITLSSEKSEEVSAQTDILGRVIFPDISFGEYHASFTLDAYETVEFFFSFLRPDQTLYGRMYSLDHLLENAQNAIEQQDWIQAEQWLVRAEALEMQPMLTGFSRAILYWKMDKPTEAVRHLEYLAKQFNPLPAEMLLFQADIYQYDLKQPKNAIRTLGKYLQQTDDTMVSERKKSLEQNKRSNDEAKEQGKPEIKNQENMEGNQGG